MKFNKIALAGALAGMVTSGASIAATDGGIGNATNGSQGTVDLTLVIPSLIRIGGMTNILFDFDAYTLAGGTGDLVGPSGAWVCTNGTTAYGITATSATGGGSFLMTGTGATPPTIAYTVFWEDDNGIDPPAFGALSHGTLSSGLTPEGTTLGGAACTPTAGKLEVRVAETAIDAAVADTYTDTLVLTVVPE